MNFRSHLNARFLASACVTIALAASACRSNVNAEFVRAERAFAEKNYGEAIKAYEAVQNSDPQNEHAMRQIGLAYIATGNRVDGMRLLESARTALPSDTVARLTLGKLYLEDGSADKAIAEANAVLANNADNITGLKIAGSGYLGAKQPQDALDAFQKLVRLAPKDSSALYLLGVGLTASGNTNAAIQAFESALTLAPTFLDALTRIVELDLAAQHGPEAIARVKKQSALIGSTPVIDELLAIAYIGAGDNANAEITLRKVIAGSTGYIDPYVRLSELYRASGQYDEALAMVDGALKIDPKNLSVRLVQGVTYEAKGDKPRAAKAYEEALQVDPRFVPALNNLATLLAETKSTQDRALKLIVHAREIEPANPAVLDTYGWVLFQRGDLEKAISVLTEATEKLPGEPSVAYHLGMAQLKNGDAEAARREFTRALASRTPFAERSATQRALFVAAH